MDSHEKKAQAKLGPSASVSSDSLAGRMAGEDSDDYVNASYVQPLGTKKKYIATQGPLPETFVDFWTYVFFIFHFISLFFVGFFLPLPCYLCAPVGQNGRWSV